MKRALNESITHEKIITTTQFVLYTLYNP